MKEITDNKTKNILLVYPETPDTFWGFNHALRFISKKAVYPPLGLLTISSMLPLQWNKKLVDMNVSKLKTIDLKWADFVFISAMTIQRKSVENILRVCLENGVRIIAGGPLFSAYPEEFEEIDALVLNEAEEIFPQLLRDIKNNCVKKIYSSDEYPSLNLSPVPDWNLIDIRSYGSLNIQYSRGCPFNCDFCDIKVLFGDEVRTKNLKQIEDELDKMYLVGWRGGVFFVDDNFAGDLTKLKYEILPGIINWQKEKNHPFIFSTEASINIARDKELLSLLVDAGFDSIFVGIETPSEAGLKECGKTQNKNIDLIKSINTIQDHGIEVKGGFIIGFDSDTESIFERQINFIKNSSIVVAMVGLLNAPKNTKLYKRLKSEDRIVTEQSGDNTNFSINFIPTMDLDILKKGYSDVIKGLYSCRLYYNRVKDYLKRKKIVKKNSSKFSLIQLKAFLKSIFILGIKDKGRFYYWKLFFWSLFRRPSVFPLAITYSIYGFHFRKIFNV